MICVMCCALPLPLHTSGKLGPRNPETQTDRKPGVRSRQPVGQSVSNLFSTTVEGRGSSSWRVVRVAFCQKGASSGRASGNREMHRKAEVQLISTRCSVTIHTSLARVCSLSILCRFITFLSHFGLWDAWRVYESTFRTVSNSLFTCKLNKCGFLIT